MVDVMCMGLLELRGARSDNNRMINSCQQRDSNSRPLDCEAITVTVCRLRDLIHYRQVKTSPDFTSAMNIEHHCSRYLHHNTQLKSVLSCILY